MELAQPSSFCRQPIKDLRFSSDFCQDPCKHSIERRQATSLPRQAAHATNHEQSEG